MGHKNATLLSSLIPSSIYASEPPILDSVLPRTSSLIKKWLNNFERNLPIMAMIVCLLRVVWSAQLTSDLCKHCNKYIILLIVDSICCIFQYSERICSFLGADIFLSSLYISVMAIYGLCPFQNLFPWDILWRLVLMALVFKNFEFYYLRKVLPPPIHPLPNNSQ